MFYIVLFILHVLGTCAEQPLKSQELGVDVPISLARHGVLRMALNFVDSDSELTGKVPVHNRASNLATQL